MTINRTAYALILSVSMLAVQPPPAPDVKPTAPLVKSISEKQRGDYWFARYKVAENELAIARAKSDALERLLMQQATGERDKTSQAVMQSCPTAAMNTAGDIECK